MADTDAAKDTRGAAAPLPLSGVRVLDIATFLAAPYAAAIFSEFGAEVIKIEEPVAGDPFRRFGTADRPGQTRRSPGSPRRATSAR